MLDQGETILLRLKGGPREGQSMVPLMFFDNKWPLPEALPVDGGVYKKTNQSKLTETYPNVMRGVEYQWIETEKQDAEAGDA